MIDNTPGLLTTSAELLSSDGGRGIGSGGGGLLGEAMAPASSWEKDLQSSESEKKLESRVMGPGLKPGPLEKNVSAKERGGGVMVGREGAEDLADDDGIGCCCCSSFSAI